MGDWVQTFKHNEDEPEVAQRHERLLPLQREDVRDGHAVDKTNDDLAYEPGPEDDAGKPFRPGEDDKEGEERQEWDDWVLCKLSSHTCQCEGTTEFFTLRML